jgi:hypothetical protein
MGSVIAPILGQQQAQAQLNAANAAQQQALGQWNGISAPSVESQQLNLQDYANAGNLNLQNEQALQQGPNALGNIQTDPRLVQAQMSALQQLSQTGQMGMTPAEQAALNQAQNNAASQAQAKNAQIMNQFAATGMGGSGAQLAAQLNNSQASAQQLANNSNQVAQNAQQNALQAISQAGTLGGQMQAQSFGQQAQVAAAQNYINQFNTQNSQQVQNQNVQAANAAALRNLNNQQQIMNQNTQLGNQQQQYNKQLLQQQFNNQAALAAGRSGQYNGIAQTQMQQAGNTANMYAGIGQGVDTGVGALYNASQKSGDGFSDDEQNNFLNSGSGGYSMPSYDSGYGSQAGGVGDTGVSEDEAGEAGEMFA